MAMPMSQNNYDRQCPRPGLDALSCGSGFQRLDGRLLVQKRTWNPSFTPCLRSRNSSWHSLRNAMTADMSISLNVVSMAIAWLASTNRRATARRSGLMRTTSSRRPGATAFGWGAETGRQRRRTVGASFGAGGAFCFQCRRRRCGRRLLCRRNGFCFWNGCCGWGRRWRGGSLR